MSEIITRTERIAKDADGIIHCVVIDGVFMELEDAQENIQKVSEIVGNQKLPVLVDIRKAKGASRECRAYFAGDEAAKYQSAVALLIDSPLSRLLGNFFLGLNKTKFPTKLFTDQEEAVDWLKKYL